MQTEDIAARLQALQVQVVAMGDQVELMVIQAADLLQRCDLAGLERLGAEERKMHELRLSIELGCLSLLVAQRSRDGNLRSAVAIMEIASELEQVGQHARLIARANYLALERCFGESLLSIRHLADHVQTMLHESVAALSRWDEAAVMDILEQAMEAEPMFDTVHHELLVLMQRRPRFANQAIHLARSVNQLKQAAGKIASICEWIVFAIRGDIHATSNV
jgi:phosphate transport system protein